MITKIDNTIDNRLDGMKAVLIEMIDEKLSNITKSHGSITARQVSFVDQAEQQRATTNDLKKNVDEDYNRKESAGNMMIHGKEENHDDAVYVGNLIKAVTCKAIKPKCIERIGKLERNKKRPIKITLQNVEDKETIMKNLCNLKTKQEYHDISVGDDFTTMERKMIKGLVNEAKQRSEKESEKSKYIWRVFGTPNKGLTLKRILKRSTKTTIIR